MNNPIYPFYPYDYKGLIEANAECAVIRGDRAVPGYSGHCGYCVFQRDEIPVEWHGNYSADGLGLLSVHGGITYCEVEGGDMAARNAALKELWAEKELRYAEQKAAGTEFISLWGEYHERGKKMRLEFGYTHVVFGFDTAHYGDESNGELFNPSHVMNLARVMRQQIAAHAKVIREYREADESGRLAILDAIRTTAEQPSAVSVFGLVSLLAKASP